MLRWECRKIALDSKIHVHLDPTCVSLHPFEFILCVSLWVSGGGALEIRVCHRTATSYSSSRRRRWCVTYSPRSAWSVSCCTGPLRCHWRPSPWTCTCCWSGGRPPCRWSPFPRTLPAKDAQKLSAQTAEPSSEELRHRADGLAFLNLLSHTAPRRSPPFVFGGIRSNKSEFVRLRVGEEAHARV